MDVVKPFLGFSYSGRGVKSNNVSEFVCFEEFLTFSKKEDFKRGPVSDLNVSNLVASSNANDIFKKWIDGGILVSSNLPALYVYEMSYKVLDRKYCLRGIVGDLKLDQEKNCKEVENNDLENGLNFQVDLVCAFYEGRFGDEISDLVSKTVKSPCFVRAKKSNVVHRVWKIIDEQSLDVLLKFLNSKTYHVVSSNGGKCSNHSMALLIEKDDPAATILPVHGVVCDLDMFDGGEILKQSAKFFEAEKCKTLNSMRNKMFGLKGENRRAFGFYADGEYYVLTLKDGVLKNESLGGEFDSEIFEELFFKRILNLNSQQVGYSQFDCEACSAVDEGLACFAVFFTAPRKSEIVDALKIGKDFSNKNYVFFPKPLKGLLFCGNSTV